ncbi:hypothetical protein GUJ93_ZPchr0012g21292 [Zizania palustris]|uniref:Uncharacterized protein n=1 Tax=Zizania palustris TaxID=103762 RepID=A0A8J6BSI1_ZIZPA|nr:hypothetical protein GUJ93_ZPchr0012g21292 [Zizania palustris]
MEVLTVSNTIAALAKLLCFVVVFPAGDLRHATAIHSIHLLFISSVSSHLAFFYNTLMLDACSLAAINWTNSAGWFPSVNSLDKAGCGFTSKLGSLIRSLFESLKISAGPRISDESRYIMGIQKVFSGS